MNEQLQRFAREELKRGLAQLPEGWQNTFKRMYAHGKPDMGINEVIDAMPANKLDWAMQQVESSLKKICVRGQEC
jgi:hypothetical protein